MLGHLDLHHVQPVQSVAAFLHSDSDQEKINTIDTIESI